MRWIANSGPGTGAAVSLLLTLLTLPFPAGAAEYRLQVVSVYEEAFSALLRPGELVDGAAGPGLNRLEASLDRAEFPMGAILWDRPLETARDRTARAYGAVIVRPDVPKTEVPKLWHELRWEGRPGEQTVWKVSPTGLRIGQLDRVALKGRGDLRHFLPFTAGTNGRRGQALAVPLLYLSAEEERGTLWPEYLSRVVDLADGIAAVVGVNPNRSFADEVYLLVRHGDHPITYKAVLSWRPRDRSHLNELEAPGVDRGR